MNWCMVAACKEEEKKTTLARELEGAKELFVFAPTWKIGERDRRRNLSLMIIPTVLQKFLERCSLRASVSYGLTRKKEEDLFRSCKEFRYRHRFISSASYTTPPIQHVSRSSVFLPSISFVPTIQRSTCRRYDYFLHLFHLSDIPPCAQPPSSSLVIVIGSNL